MRTPLTVYAQETTWPCTCCRR